VSTVIAVAHHAGGVGKTTTALSLGYALAAAGHRVLLADLDPQADLSQRLGIEPGVSTLAQSLTTGRNRPTIIAQQWDGIGLDILPSDMEQMAGIELELTSAMERERRLGRILNHPACAGYDFVLLDCPPALNLLTVNALYAADTVLIPVQAQDKAVRQLAPLLQSIEDVQGYRNGPPIILGMLLTMTDGTRQSSESEAALRDTYTAWVFEATIPRRTALADDGRYHAPVAVYQPLNSASMAYTALAQEVQARAQH
jgi:chromosome partitioning protein